MGAFPWPSFADVGSLLLFFLAQRVKGSRRSMVGARGSLLGACVRPRCSQAQGWRRLAGLILLVGIVASTSGCGGCWRDPEDPTQAGADPSGGAGRVGDAKQKAETEPKEDFERLRATMLPGNEPASDRDRPPLLVKPGHWVALSETWVAHRADFAGELASFVDETSSLRPEPLEFFPARIWPRFPAVLPKGQPKRIETLLYVPSRSEDTGASSRDTAMVASIRSQLSRRGERAPVAAASTLVRMMQEHEYLLVVLAGGSVLPSAYAHLDQLPSVYLPQIEGPKGTTLRHYHVVRPKIDRSVPLPAHSLAWTTISHVIWDGVDPALFSTPQQEALLDWLHWGGQLVISGPESLEKLRGSFLAPYLPGEAVGTVPLDEVAFSELNDRFSLPLPVVRGDTRPTKGEAVRRIRILPGQPIVGVELRPHPAAVPVEGTGALVWERRVGGGRIVVVRFPLTDPRIKVWKNLDNFVNGVVLRRPGRQFQLSSDGNVHVAWRAEFFQHLLEQDPWGARSYIHSPEELGKSLFRDPRLNSTVRFLSRDLVPESLDKTPYGDDRRTAPPIVQDFSWNQSWWRKPPPAVSSDVLRGAEHLSDWHFGGYGWQPPLGDGERPGGVASWNEGSALGRAADAVLIRAAGIKIPSAAFVWKAMAVYLVVLVPLNALVFWLIGRLEWAWAAVPVLAGAAALAVVRMAQLDIGFSRSRTEVALLEVQGGYPRGHLTRFTALYSSLSTRYALSFEPAHAVVLPHAARSRNSRTELLRQVTDLTLQRDRAVTLQDVPVASNSTAILRSEQFLPLGEAGPGPAVLELAQDAAGTWSLANGTVLDLHEVGLFRLPSPDERPLATWRGEEAAEVAYLPRLKPGAKATLTWVPLGRQAAAPSQPAAVEETQGEELQRPVLWLKPWNASPILGWPSAGERGRQRLTELAVVVLRDLKLLPGEVRLVAWTDQNLPGLTIRPHASQNQTLTLVVAHLARGRLPPPLPDKNRLDDVVAVELDALPDVEPSPGSPPGR